MVNHHTQTHGFHVPALARLLFCVTIIASACGTTLPAQVLPFQYYTVKEGLISNAIRCITQDSYGYLWIGTAEGISVYDGASFKNYTSVDGLLNSYINWMTESRRTPGTMWVATNGGGVCRITGTTLNVIQTGSAEIENRVNMLAEDEEGILWCATDGGLFTIKEGVARKIFPDTIRTAVVAVCALDEGVVLFATQTKVISFNKRDQEFRTLSIPPALNTSLQTMVVIGPGECWAAGTHGQLFHIKNWKIQRPFSLKGHPNINLLTTDNDGAIWLSTTGGLLRIPPGSVEGDDFSLLTDENGLPESDMAAVYRDRESSLWIGSWSKGLSKLSRRSVYQFPHPARSPATAYAVTVDATEHFWVVIRDALEEIWRTRDGGWRRKVHRLASQLGSPSLISYESDKHGLWIASEDSRLTFLTIQSRSGLPSRLHAQIRLLPGEDFPAGEIPVFRVESPSRIYVSLQGLGVALIDTRDRMRLLRVYKASDGFFADDVRALHLDKRGNLWMGDFQRGLVKLEDPDSAQPLVKHYTVDNGLSDNNIRALCEDHLGRIWVGTRYGGLTVIQGNYLRAVTMKEGLLSNSVWCINEDDQGTIWLGTSSGLQSVKLDSSFHFETFEELRGSLIHSCAVSAAGILWANRHEDITFIDLNEKSKPAPPPPVYITSVKVNGEEVRFADGLDLPYSQSTLSIDFIGISFVSPAEVRYRYIIEDVDQQWQQPTRNRTITLAAFKPGSYRFLVNAINTDGVESIAPAVLRFTIHPPFWRRWWFISIALLCVLATAVALHRYRLTKLLEVERVRTRIATDLHDDIGADLTQIAILSEVLKPMIGKPDGQAVLDKIGMTARRIIDSMSDLVWSIDPQQDAVEGLVQRIQELAGELLRTKEIAFAAEVDPGLNDLRLIPEIRRELFLIIKEALHNAVRHSECKAISLTLHETGSRIVVEMQDDGHGMNIESLRKGHGLENMQTRTRNLGGTFSVTSGVGRGTRLRIEIPSSRQKRRTTTLSS